MAANIGQPFEDHTNGNNFHSNAPNLRQSIAVSDGFVASSAGPSVQSKHEN
jgi:hypothetical protein